MSQSRLFRDLVANEIHSFTEMVKKMEKLVGELYRSLPEEEDGDGDAVAWSPICFNMVGLSDMFNQLKPKAIEFEVLSVMRMGGIGKTTLATGKTTLAIGKTTLAIGKTTLAIGKTTLARDDSC